MVQKTNASDLYTYDSTREREEEKQKDQGGGVIEKKGMIEEKWKNKQHILWVQFHTYEAQFFTFLCGYPIWGHMIESYTVPNYSIQFLTFWESS